MTGYKNNIDDTPRVWSPNKFNISSFDILTPPPLLISFIKSQLQQSGIARAQLLLPQSDAASEVLEHMIMEISKKIGFLLPQTYQGNLVAHIQDEGSDYANHAVRGHKTSSELAFHSDRCDINMLLYVRPAAQGGEVSIVSYEEAATILQKRYPQAFDALCDGFTFDLREERIFPSLKWHWRPVIWRTGQGLRGHYIRRFITDSQRHEDCPRLTATQLAALDQFDEVLAEIKGDHSFAPSANELVVFDNYRVMHARTAFCNQDSKRLVLRTWVAPFESEPLPPFLHPLAGSCRPGVFRGGVGTGEDFHARLGERL